jgi:hypothetical protein
MNHASILSLEQYTSRLPQFDLDVEPERARISLGESVVLLARRSSVPPAPAATAGAWDDEPEDLFPGVIPPWRAAPPADLWDVEE